MTIGREAEELVGRTVVRIDGPLPGWLCISLASSPRACLHVVVSRGEAVLAASDERVRGASATGVVLTLRRVLEGATVRALSGARGVVAVEFDTERGPRTLVGEGGRERADFALLDGPRLVFGHASEEALARPQIPLSAIPDAEALVEVHAAALVSARRQDLLARIHERRRRAARNAAAARADAARASTVVALRRDADLLTALAPDDRPGRSAITLDDFHADPPAPRVLELDPRLGPRTQGERLYGRARKLERGLAIASTRAAALDAEVARLDSVASAISAATSPIELLRLAAAEGLDRETTEGSARRTRQPERSPYRTFVTTSGRLVRVGRSAKDNDALTLRHASPRDRFLHVRGRAGSHVILVVGDGEPTDADVLDAATLAAHFSPARGESIVEVTIAERRHVHKPKGAPSGSVRVEREKTIALRVEPDRLERLLRDERPR